MDCSNCPRRRKATASCNAHMSAGTGERWVPEIWSWSAHHHCHPTCSNPACSSRNCLTSSEFTLRFEGLGGSAATRNHQESSRVQPPVGRAPPVSPVADRNMKKEPKKVPHSPHVPHCHRAMCHSAIYLYTTLVTVCHQCCTPQYAAPDSCRAQELALAAQPPLNPLAKLNKEQLNRYEVYRRSSFPHAKMEQVMSVFKCC